MLLAVIAMLAGCTQSKEKGTAMAAEFVNAWTSEGDTLSRHIERVNAALDSLTFKGPFVDAFIEEAGKADSTIALAARVLLVDSAEVTASLCDEIIDGLASGNLNYRQAGARVMQLAQVCNKLGREGLNKAFGEMLDSKAASLSLDKQMKVYSSATTPEKLGKALKADAAAAGADQALINSQVEALKGIYSANDYKKFIDAYKND